MKPIYLTVTLLLTSMVTPCWADDATSNSTTMTGNVEVVSDYIFRGLTQSWGGSALQGGGDLSLSDGLSAGFWGSSISKNEYPGALMEFDLYGAYAHSINDDWSWTVGLHSYLYPKGNADQATPPLKSDSFDTVEANAALTWRWFTLTYNRSLTDYFGIDTEEGYTSDSRGTSYLQADAAFLVNPTWTLGLHAGHTAIAPTLGPSSSASYSDYGVSIKWQFASHGFVTLGATRATNSKFYGNTVSFEDPADVKDIGGTRGYVLLGTTF